MSDIDYDAYIQELQGRAVVSESRLRHARKLSQDHAAYRRTHSNRVGKTGRYEMGVPADALDNAINSEGPEVMTAAADGYWADQRRLYPELGGGGDVLTPAGMVNRHGRVKTRIVWRDGVKTVIHAETP
tara:strand:- start:3571 stop:3957 length:387 start_codon:yes stop_codon:yes gene_type:complete